MKKRQLESRHYVAIFLPIGIGIGTAIGVALGKVGIGVGIGAGVGILLSFFAAHITNKDEAP